MIYYSMYDKEEKWLMSVGLNSKSLDEIVKDEVEYHHESDMPIKFEKMSDTEKLKLIFEYHHGFYNSNYDFRIIKHDKKFAQDDTEKLTNVNEGDIKKLSNVIELLTHDEALTEFGLDRMKRITFTMELTGLGNNEAEAKADAIEQLQNTIYDQVEISSWLEVKSVEEVEE